MSAIKHLELAWFRGASERVVYLCEGRSIVIYGENAAGKSSFVDGLEVLMAGKCEHLSHEYSGTHQEKGLINTHRPDGAATKVELQFMDGTSSAALISKPAKPTASGSAKDTVEGWNYQRVVLRQDEIASFIKATKLKKYSDLLPLLGLGHLETAAENIRQLARSVGDKGQLKFKQGELNSALTARAEAFGEKTDAEIDKVVAAVYARHVTGSETDAVRQHKAAADEIQRLQTNFSTEERRFQALKTLADLEITTEVAGLVASSAKLQNLSEVLVQERLAVVNAADDFASKVDTDTVNCPACGTEVSVADFRSHLEAEKERLKEIQETDKAHKHALSAFCDAVLRLKNSWQISDLKVWKEKPENADLVTQAEKLTRYDLTAMRLSCPGDRIDEIAGLAAAIREAALKDSFEAPSSVQSLYENARMLEAAARSRGVKDLEQEISELESLVGYLIELENAIRTEIRTQARTVFKAISKDIQELWDQFHPDKKIQDVHLHVPFDADKAIDVAVQFYGVPQSSPRLTLSEGYRNSLGLSIFLALAKRESAETPIVLDDVVISLDRNHRGMLADILESEFKDRQIILLTHERDWYIELTYLLPRPHWNFLMLQPWQDPETGIRFQDHADNFGVARAQLDSRPDSAGNDARKIMDTQLPIIAERLGVRLPYLRGTKNDKRTGVEFIGQLISDGGKVFQIRKSGTSDYEKNESAVLLLKEAEKRMIAWGNPASHTFDVRKAEAEKLISDCKSALGVFECDDCKKPVWFANTGNSEMVQCQCGEIRWRYGKA